MVGSAAQDIMNATIAWTIHTGQCHDSDCFLLSVNPAKKAAISSKS